MEILEPTGISSISGPTTSIVILDLGGILGRDKLEAVLTRAVDLDLHVALTDDLALEGGGEGDGNVDLRDLQLDAARFDGGVDPVLGIVIDNQGLRNGPHIVVVVGNDREAELMAPAPQATVMSLTGL